MRKTATTLLLPLFLLLAGCSTFEPTPYQPVTQDSRYGFQDTRLDDDTWRVTVAGNSQTPRDLVENQLLYRAAEIALTNGATGFIVLDRDMERDVNYATTGVTMFNPYYAYPYGGFWWGAPGWGWGSYTAQTRAFSRYTAYAEVRLYEGTAPVGQGVAYDALQVKTNLAAKINRPAAPEKG